MDNYIEVRQNDDGTISGYRIGETEPAITIGQHPGWLKQIQDMALAEGQVSYDRETAAMAERHIIALGFFSILLDTDPDTGEKETMMRFFCGACASKHPDLKVADPGLYQTHEAFMRELEHRTSQCDECGILIRNY